ncbi:MAG TPA: hypothetical protein VIV13_00225 [Solirubrobacterales bacterium]
MRVVTPGRISLVTRKELSEYVAESAAITERAAARTEAAAALQQEARAQQEAAVARQEAATARFEEIQSDAAERNKRLDSILVKQDAMLEEMRADRARADEDRARAEADRDDEKVWREEYLRRQEKMFQDFLARADRAVVEGRENTEKILLVFADQSDDIRAMKEAILKLIDRFPPLPPHLRSA